MDTIKHKFTRLQNEIFRVLCINAGNPLNQNMIAKKIGVSATAVAKAIVYLEKIELIKINKNKTMNLILIELNRDNRNVMQLKRVENLKQIYGSGIVDELEEKLAGGTIILFGSYSRGDDTITSDIDIAVIGRKEKIINLESFDKLLERKININFYKSWEIDKHLRNNILNGILLSGGVEL